MLSKRKKKRTKQKNKKNTNTRVLLLVGKVALKKYKETAVVG